LALLLNEYLCPDAIATEHCWDDWEVSKNLMERFLAIWKRVEEIPFSWDLLMIVAEGKQFYKLFLCRKIENSFFSLSVLMVLFANYQSDFGSGYRPMRECDREERADAVEIIENVGEIIFGHV
jgi:hypothetical protein